MILIIVCVYSFLGNSALLGVGPYITLWSEAFDVSQADASTLISYPNLAYGLTSWLLVPLYLRFGRRPVILGSMLAVSNSGISPAHATGMLTFLHISSLEALLAAHERLASAASWRLGSSTV